MSWFENWFDSIYYHILYKDRDDDEARLFIDNIVKKLQLKTGSNIIDVACGKGRHSNYLSSLGFNVVGIDLSENSISEAKINEKENLKFHVHDMRKTYAKDCFDVALNLFTSFGYFSDQNDNQRAIQSMANNLKKGGYLIIDFMNVKKVIANLVMHEKKIIDGIIFNIVRKIKNNYITKEIFFHDKGEDYHFEEKVEIITLITFSELIKNTGLKIIDIFGNYQLIDFNAMTSERLILICKK